MKKLLLTLTTITLLLSCQNQEGKDSIGQLNINPARTEVVNDSAASESGKKWLVNTIENYFANFMEVKGDYSSFCSKQYADYKSDATNVGMDGGMSETELKKKWGRRHLMAGNSVGTGFLISTQDFGIVKVVKCEYTGKSEMGNYCYNVILEDEEFKTRFVRDIMLVRDGNSFLIENVKE